MIDYFTLSLDDSGIATLTIDQPDSQVNVMDQHFIDSLEHHLLRIFADDAIRAVILTSAKSSFIAGADLNTLEKTLNEPVDATTLYQKCLAFSMLLRRIETCGKPFVAALNGPALGGGFELALACHGRIAADTPALKVGLPEVGVGLLPGAGGTQRYLRMLGVQAALPLLLQGKQLTATSALKQGLVDKVCPSEQLLSHARAWLNDNPQALQPWDMPGFTIPGGQDPSTPALAQLFMATSANLSATTFGNMPAPFAITSCLYEGMQLPMDKALAVECKQFVRLNIDPVAGNMVRTGFINKTRADSLMHRPKHIAVTQHTDIAVLGAGLMGAGIALCAAQAGIRVRLLDCDLTKAQKGKAYSEKKLSKLCEKGRLSPTEMDNILARIEPSEQWESLAEVTLAVEAVFEDRDVKAQVYARAEAHLPATAVLASNTSALPITGLAETLSCPQRMIGLHFFSPVERMPLVEVIKAQQTDDATLASALDFVAQLSKTPILVNDSRGFFTSRFFGAFLNEGVTMVQEGINPALIENAARHFGYPVGPLSISDEVGLDLASHGADQAKADLGDEFTPGSSVSVIQTLVKQHGRFGRKNAMGFYQYQADGSKSLWAGLNDIWPQLPASEQPDQHSVQTRMLYAQLADAARAMAEGVLASAADGDIGACFGVGFPFYLGGPFATMDTIGLEQVITTCDALAAQHCAQRFALPAMLRQMAANGQQFYGNNAIVFPMPKHANADSDTRAKS